MAYKHYRRHKNHRRNRYRPKYSTFQKMIYFATHHPITVGVGLIIISFILFRISFTNSFLSSSEVFIWSIILSIGLFIAGILTLVGWWRNHISMLTTRHTMNWR